MPGAVVDHADLDPCPSADASPRPRRVVSGAGEPQRVVDQLLEDAPGDAAVQVRRAGTGLRRRRPPGRARSRAATSRATWLTSTCSVNAGVDGELEAFDEPGEVRRASTSRVEQLVALLRRCVASASVCATPEDHGDGRSQLVGQARDQFVAPRRALDERLLRGLELARVRRRSRSSASVSSSITVGVTPGDSTRPALGGLHDGVEDLVAVGVLQDVPGGAGDEHVADDRPGPRDRTGRRRRARGSVLQPARGLDAVHLRHPDVHQRRRRARSVRDQLERLGARCWPRRPPGGRRRPGATAATRGNPRCRRRRGPGSAGCRPDAAGKDAAPWRGMCPGPGTLHAYPASVGFSGARAHGVAGTACSVPRPMASAPRSAEPAAHPGAARWVCYPAADLLAARAATGPRGCRRGSRRRGAATPAPGGPTRGPRRAQPAEDGVFRARNEAPQEAGDAGPASEREPTGPGRRPVRNRRRPANPASPPRPRRPSPLPARRERR